MIPQKTCLDSLRSLSRFVSYQRLSPKFQSSLFEVSLPVLYLYVVQSLVNTQKCFACYKYILNCHRCTPLAALRDAVMIFKIVWGSDEWRFARKLK
jgi:hypothetical protein